MPHDPPDYNKATKERYMNNRDEVLIQLKNGCDYLKQKMSLFSTRFNYSLDDIRNKIKSDEMFRCFFIKDPLKQGIHQETAADWLKGLPLRRFKILDSVGKGALFITSDGEIVKGKNPAKAKSLDFFWKEANYEFYATHKYTKQSGGSQDNQYKDVLIDLKKWQNGGAKDNQILVAIVDGDYYTEKKMRELYRVCRRNPPYSFAVDISKIPSLMKAANKGNSVLSNWK